MRVPIPHNLPKEEVRNRLRTRRPEIKNAIPGGMADVSTDWPNEDCMNLRVVAMGQTVAGRILIEERQVIFEAELPLALSFVEPLIRGAVEHQGQKLLAPKRD